MWLTVTSVLVGLIVAVGAQRFVSAPAVLPAQWMALLVFALVQPAAIPGSRTPTPTPPSGAADTIDTALAAPRAIGPARTST